MVSWSNRAEQMAREFARAWGQMGPLWAVPPALARVHGYLLVRRIPLSEREIREALGLSHRAASLALSECEAWGLVRQVEPRRSGRRGPAGMAYQAVEDHWRYSVSATVASGSIEMQRILLSRSLLS